MSNRLAIYNELYKPNVIIDSLSESIIPINTTYQIIATGNFIDYIKEIKFASEPNQINNNYTTANIVSKDFNQCTFEIITNSYIGNYYIDFIDFDNNVITKIVQTNNISIIYPNNPPLGTNQAIWENKVGDCAVAGNTGLQFVQKTSTSSSWDSQATFQGVPANKDFELSFNVVGLSNSVSAYGMFGMNTLNTTASFSDIDFAFYILNNTNIICYENGSYKAGLGNNINNPTLKIKRVGNIVTYLIDDVVKRTVNNATTSALIFDCSLYRAIRCENIKLIVY